MTCGGGGGGRQISLPAASRVEMSLKSCILNVLFIFPLSCFPHLNRERFFID